MKQATLINLSRNHTPLTFSEKSSFSWSFGTNLFTEKHSKRKSFDSGRGEDFLMGQLNFFTERAVTPERRDEKWFPKWEINRHAEG